MIKKLKSIDNLAVFNGFRWDSSVINADGQAQVFEKLNILYGRNYSGKTTLSRIVRAFETQALPERHDNPQFEIQLSDGTMLNQASLGSHGLNIRVFNEDFMRTHLRFLVDSDGEIAPFAVLGEDNATIEEEIAELERQLGSDEVGNESGLRHNYAIAAAEAERTCSDYEDAKNDLEAKLSKKAIDNEIGIKYCSAKFGDINYTITKLKNEINLVLAPTYVPLTADEIASQEKTVDEQEKPNTEAISSPKLSFEVYCQQAAELLSRQIGSSAKIQELLLDTVLNT